MAKYPVLLNYLPVAVFLMRPKLPYSHWDFSIPRQSPNNLTEHLNHPQFFLSALLFLHFVLLHRQQFFLSATPFPGDLFLYRRVSYQYIFRLTNPMPTVTKWLFPIQFRCIIFYTQLQNVRDAAYCIAAAPLLEELNYIFAKRYM